MILSDWSIDFYAQVVLQLRFDLLNSLVHERWRCTRKMFACDTNRAVTSTVPCCGGDILLTLFRGQPWPKMGALPHKSMHVLLPVLPPLEYQHNNNTLVKSFLRSWTSFFSGNLASLRPFESYQEYIMLLLSSCEPGTFINSMDLMSHLRFCCKCIGISDSIKLFSVYNLHFRLAVVGMMMLLNDFAPFESRFFGLSMRC